MFKITATLFVYAENRSTFIEQTFTKDEKPLAIHVATSLEKTPGYTNVRLFEVKTGKNGGIVAVKFGQALVKPVKVATVKKPRKTATIAASVSEFDLPPATPKKRVTKRERNYGNTKVAV